MPRIAKRVPFQQITVEYRVSGTFDGTTVAPNVVLDPSSDDFNEADDRGIHVVDVPGNLGIVDPDLIGSAAQGDRCIPWVYIDTSGVAGIVTSRIAVVDNVERDDGINVPQSQLTKFTTGGIPLFYSDVSTRIPQGSALGIVGYLEDGVKILRLNIVAPHDAHEFANMLEACCCKGQECPDPPEIDDIDENVLFTGESTDVTFDVTGGGFPESGLAATLWLIQREDGEKEDESGGALLGEYVGQVSGVSATFRLTPPDDTPPGVFIPVISNPNDPPCNNTGPAIGPGTPTLTIWPADCPWVEEPQPGIPNVITEGGGVQNFTVSGQNFAGPTVGEIRLIHQATGTLMDPVSFATDSDIQLTVTVNPVAPGDPTGLYDLVMIPLGAGCPTQKVLGVVSVLTA